VIIMPLRPKAIATSPRSNRPLSGALTEYAIAASGKVFKAHVASPKGKPTFARAMKLRSAFPLRT